MKPNNLEKAVELHDQMVQLESELEKLNIVSGMEPFVSDAIVDIKLWVDLYDETGAGNYHAYGENGLIEAESFMNFDQIGIRKDAILTALQVLLEDRKLELLAEIRKL